MPSYFIIIVMHTSTFIIIGAQPFQGPYLEPNTGPIVLNDVHCNSTEATLLDCKQGRC